MADEVKDPESSESERRDFLTKAVAAAGALAATGLLSGLMSGEAEGAVATRAGAPAAVIGKKVTLQRAPLQYQKLKDGHVLELQSTELTNVLAREGLISKDLMGKQSLMRVEVRYSL